MKRYQKAGLYLVAVTAAFWAFIIVDELINDFADEINYVDFGAVFVLGVISGIALGLALSIKKRPNIA